MSKRIEIIVDPKGNTTVATKGFAGNSCVEASRFIEEALGKKSAERKTADFFATTPTNVQQNQQSG